MREEKTLEIISKKEGTQFGKEKLLRIKSSLTSCLDGIKEMGKIWTKSIWWLVKTVAGKISNVFGQISWDAMTLSEDFIQEHLSHYWF